MGSSDDDAVDARPSGLNPASRFLVAVLLGLCAIVGLSLAVLARPVVVNWLRNRHDPQPNLVQTRTHAKKRIRRPKLVEVWITNTSGRPTLDKYAVLDGEISRPVSLMIDLIPSSESGSEKGPGCSKRRVSSMILQASNEEKATSSTEKGSEASVSAFIYMPEPSRATYWGNQNRSIHEDSYSAPNVDNLSGSTPSSRSSEDTRCTSSSVCPPSLHFAVTRLPLNGVYLESYS